MTEIQVKWVLSECRGIAFENYYSFVVTSQCVKSIASKEFLFFFILGTPGDKGKIGKKGQPGKLKMVPGEVGLRGLKGNKGNITGVFGPRGEDGDQGVRGLKGHCLNILFLYHHHGTSIISLIKNYS